MKTFRALIVVGLTSALCACTSGGGETKADEPAGDGHAHDHMSMTPMASETPHGDGGIAEDHGHLARHGGQVGMSAEPGLHLEAVRTTDEVRLYVYDASMTPVPIGEVSGSVKIAGASLPLQPRAAEGYLSAKFSKPGTVGAAFVLTVRGTRVPMEFDLAEAVAASPSATSASVEIGGHLAKITLSGSKLVVEVTEKNGGPPESAKNAKVVLQLGSEKKTVPLDGTDGHFSATLDAAKSDKIVGVLQLDLDGKPASARFSLDRHAP